MVLFLSAEGSRAACRSALASHNMSCHSGDMKCFFYRRSARGSAPAYGSVVLVLFLSLPGTCTRFALLSSCCVPGYFQSRLSALRSRGG